MNCRRRPPFSSLFSSLRLRPTNQTYPTSPTLPPCRPSCSLALALVFRPVSFSLSFSSVRSFLARRMERSLPISLLVLISLPLTDSQPTVSLTYLPTSSTPLYLDAVREENEPPSFSRLPYLLSEASSLTSLPPSPPSLALTSNLLTYLHAFHFHTSFIPYHTFFRFRSNDPTSLIPLFSFISFSRSLVRSLFCSCVFSFRSLIVLS